LSFRPREAAPERVSRGVVAARFPSAVSLHRYVHATDRREYSCRRGERACDRQLGWTLRAWLSDLLLQSIGLTAFLLPLWLEAWMDLDAFAAQRLGVAALDGHISGAGIYACRVRLLPWHWRWLHLVPLKG